MDVRRRGVFAPGPSGASRNPPASMRGQRARSSRGVAWLMAKGLPDPGTGSCGTGRRRPFWVAQHCGTRCSGHCRSPRRCAARRAWSRRYHGVSPPEHRGPTTARSMCHARLGSTRWAVGLRCSRHGFLSGFLPGRACVARGQGRLRAASQTARPQLTEPPPTRRRRGPMRRPQGRLARLTALGPTYV